LQSDFKYLILEDKYIFWLNLLPKVNTDKFINWFREYDKGWLKSESKVNSRKFINWFRESDKDWLKWECLWL